MIFPNLRTKTTGEFLKLYTNNHEEYHSLKETIKQLHYQFYVITARNDRPIKVVIKGLPKSTHVDEIKLDLKEQGFEPERVVQLIGRKTKNPLPVYMISLPRNITDLKIFHIKTLGYLSIRVEPYEGRGITQCFTCNNFNHTSENFYITPRCLKCGEAHITRDCPIKQKLEQLYCINCQIYGYMANWQGCPCYPKPPKGATTHKNKNTFTNIFNSIVRYNTTYAQVTSTKQNTNNYKNQRQMAPHYNQHAGNSRQTGAINLPPITPVPIQNYPLNQNNASIQQTLQLAIYALTQVSQAFNGATGIGQNLNQISAAQGNPNQMYGLIEAACNTNYV
ncbi:nucleic-acid-binding protein from transposon X-element [Trichonephila clavipes]|nr:nucleic-acid-binding protein from transposon X-element [Trichonephila clavipes]